uniref:Uncharacterized protein n=1 Tax=Panagrolaimus sp. PS1159 TaxID=55785 RepID=A0AC35FR90_9BILA
MADKIFFILCLVFFTKINIHFCYDNSCDSLPNLVQLNNEGETGIVSQPSFCPTGYTVMAQNNNENKNIKIRFTMVPSNFDIQIYDGKIRDSRIQNCQIQNGSICYSTGNTVTFYFVPINAFNGFNNRVELSVATYNDINNGSIISFSFLTLFLCAFAFVYQIFV